MKNRLAIVLIFILRLVKSVNCRNDLRKEFELIAKGY